MIDQRFGATLALISCGATPTEALALAGLSKREFLSMARSSNNLRELWLIYADRWAEVEHYRRYPQALLQRLTK